MKNGQSKIDKLHDKTRIAFLAYFRSLRHCITYGSINGNRNALILQFRPYYILHKGE
jgi:hypothetical protein